MSERRILIIAGPNGAGKTTFAQEFLPGEAGCPIFVNADLIAAGLSPFTPELVAVRTGNTEEQGQACVIALQRNGAGALSFEAGDNRKVAVQIVDDRGIGFQENFFTPDFFAAFCKSSSSVASGMPSLKASSR